MANRTYHSNIKLLFFSVVLISVLVFGCSQKQNPFLITPNSIGPLTDSTQVKDLMLLFSNDSIVNYIGGDEFTSSINNIEIYEKGGKKLLVLSPSQTLDSTAVIKSIQIIDPRYTTVNNISILSTYKDIKDKHTISRIDNLINSIVVSVDELNASFSISKEELLPAHRYNTNNVIDTTHIPDNAKIKYFMLHWY